jgi:hypothetical protein
MRVHSGVCDLNMRNPGLSWGVMPSIREESCVELG